MRADLCRWVRDNKVESNAQPAVFKRGIRGLAAATNLQMGEAVASVPEALLIHHDTAQESDLVTPLHICSHFSELPSQAYKMALCALTIP